MRVLITGCCGFVGTSVAETLAGQQSGLALHGADNFIRSGVHLNRSRFERVGGRFWHADLRNASDLDALPAVDWVIDAAANPSVLGGIDGRSSVRQVVEHNLVGTVNVLEYCRRHGAGLILLSTSRVYSIPALAGLRLEVAGTRFKLVEHAALPAGLTSAGINERFSTAAPISLYGATKLSSEVLALEYGRTFGFPVWINRCGVLAGAGQFGTAEQGIFSYWLHAWRTPRRLRYIGFEGRGFQVRDAFHPRDLTVVLAQQLSDPGEPDADRTFNLGGGLEGSMSLAELSAWCVERFGPRPVDADLTPRSFDLPWIVMDSAQACARWDWRPRLALHQILGEIADHAEQNPGWLEVCRA
ncbi:MAG TPA: NAD-dependent epimerase/dehydratase family protein [Chthoniobacterales bacterium]